MPPKKLKENIIFLINIGIVRYGTQRNSQLLDKAKSILKHIIQKKIFLRPKDEVGIILMGSDSNKSNDIMKIDNVQELCSMQIGNWGQIESIDKLQSTNQNCSWMKAINATIEYIKHECVDNSQRKIILLSDFNEDEDVVNQFQSNDIADMIKELNLNQILLMAIGERALDNINEDSYTASEALLRNVLQKIGGQYCTFEHAMSDVRFYRRPSTKPMLWHCNMEFGDFRIPIAGISKIPNEPKLPDMLLMGKTSTSDTHDQKVLLKNVAEWTDNNRTIHMKDDIVRGYMYGGKAIPVSDDIQKTMTPKNNEKCYKIHGFTAKENVPMEYWLSDGTYLIIPTDESVSAPFYSLVQAMVDKNVVAIVEKIYRKDTEANMVALFPSVDDPNQPWCLIEIGLPFERDYGAIAQRPLKFMMKQLSKEQNDTMDNLLTSLELPDDADDDTIDGSEKYLPGYMPDPGAQCMWDVMSARALCSNQPLLPIADDVKNLLKQPKFVKEKCKAMAGKIEKLFSLEKKEPLRTIRRRKSEEQEDEEDNKQADSKDDRLLNQPDKEQIKDLKTDNNDELVNVSLSNEFNFDYDKMITDI